MLRRLRRPLVINRAELARLAQLSPSTIGRIEKGTLDPTWGTLSRILESAGFQIRGEDIVPSGDVSALVAARIVLDHEMAATGPDSLGTRILEAVLEGDEPAAPTADTVPGSMCDDGSAVTIEAAAAWLRRWHRVGWVRSEPTRFGLQMMSRGAGIIAALEHRDAPRITVGDKDSWRELAQSVGALDIDYAVSGLFTPGYIPLAGTTPAIYVRDPPAVAARLNAEDADRAGGEEGAPGERVRLVAAEGLELTNVVTDDGIRFTSTIQMLLHAFAGPSEESGTAEVSLHYLLAAHT